VERKATVRTFEVAAVLTALLALYLLALAAIESVPSLARRVDDTGVMFSLMAALVLSFSALPFAHNAWRAREGPARDAAGARGEAALLGAAEGGVAGRYGAVGPASLSAGPFAPHAAAAGAREPGAATELARMSSLPTDGDQAAADGARGATAHGYGSSDDEGAEAAAAAAADAAAGAAPAAAEVEDDVFGATKYYAGGSATLSDAFRTADYWLTVAIMFFNNAVAYSLLK